MKIQALTAHLQQAISTLLKIGPLITTLCMLNACGGGGSGQATTPQAAPPPPSPTTSKAIFLRDHLGSLYEPFDWSGPIRDPMRDAIEIQNASTFVAMSNTDLNELQATIADREIIMQIGGMGSAKLDTNATEENPQFADYMNAFLADNGQAWRNAVLARAREVASVTPTDNRIYWQVGNEVNSPSYTRNIKFYFDGTPEGMTDREFTIQVYVEYFLAPTIQSFQQIALETGKPVRIALGSISNFAALSSQQHMDDLLNYQIQGTYAPDMAGFKIHQLVELLTIHYLADADTPENPDYWYETLQDLKAKWVNNNIKGIWATEEVGIETASSGSGAAAALLVQARYWKWASENDLDATQSRWFFYGTTAGPEGQTIADSVAKVHQLVGDASMAHVSTNVDTLSEIETHAFYVPSKKALLITITSLSTDTMELSSFSANVSSLDVTDWNASAWFYGNTSTDTIETQLSSSGNTITLSLESPIQMEKPETLLFWIQ